MKLKQGVNPPFHGAHYLYGPIDCYRRVLIAPQVEIRLGVHVCDIWWIWPAFIQLFDFCYSVSSRL